MLFFGRLVLYILLMILPAFHPALAQYADAGFLLRALLLMPLAAFLGWKQCEKQTRRILHLCALALPLLTLPLLSLTTAFFELFLAVQYAYWSTWLMFRRGLARIFYADAFYFVFVTYRLLSIRSQDAQGFNSFALVLLLLGFISYAIMVYRLQFAARRPKTAELLFSLLLPIALGVIITLFLPAGFLREVRTFNSLSNIIRPPPRPLEESRNSPEEDGSLRGEESEDEGNGPGIFTLSPQNWNSGEGGEDGEDGEGNINSQYLVMIVDSPVNTLYLADEYFNHHDESRGFYSDPAFDLNLITNSQYLETWRNPTPLPLRNRRALWVDVYSTIPDKVSSYQPHLIEPTVFNNNLHPISYTYRTQSLISNISITRSYPQVGELLSVEQQDLIPYLDIRLPTALEQTYQQLLDQIIPENADYMGRIRAILEYYRSYQYELGFTDNVSTAAITSFLFDTHSGDCTEFSNSAAILGRMAGIPSRVVTGYLVADSLQTPAHRRALAELQRNYPPLAEKGLASLNLVTTAHRHSWTQFYLPIYGWVDFEPTSFAIPPTGDMDPNNLDIVIPDLEELTFVNRRLPVPWGLVFRFTFMAAAFGLLMFYSIRWTRLLRLGLLSRRNNESGFKALYRLLIIRLSARGYDLKDIDLTPQEYAELYPELQTFAHLYTKLLFRPRTAAGAEGTDQARTHGRAGAEGTDQARRLRGEYRRLLQEHRRPMAGLVELFSLRSIRYL